MEFKSKEYYEQIAKELCFQTRAFIGGRFVEASQGKTFDTINPATGEKITNVSGCGKEDVLNAEKEARKAFEDGCWVKKSPAEKKEILFRLSELIMEHQEELAVMESVDSGKPIRDTLAGDIPDTALTFRWHAEAIDKLEDAITAGDGEHLSLVVREPLGVVGAVLPWNFPLQMAAWKLAPILASGNSCVVKPAKLTSLTLLKLAELAKEAGLPDGVLNVVPGDGSVIGEALGMHPELEALTFTGSTEVGKKLLAMSGKTNAKRILFEMGGKNPCIIMPDVKDLDHAAEEAVNAVFWNMGENCTSNSRLLVHKDIKDAFVEKVVEKTKALRTGNPLDPDNHLGAIVEKKHMNTILNYIQKGKEEGGKVLCGGGPILEETGGNFIAPTVFDGVTPEMTIAKEEIFGPVLAIIEFQTEEEALRIANDTEYGLQASLFTDDLSTAHRMSRALRAGTVSVNCYSEGDIGTPFGGFKQSGFFSRDKSLQANKQYTELKTIWIQL